MNRIIRSLKEYSKLAPSGRTKYTRTSQGLGMQGLPEDANGLYQDAL